MPPGEKLSLPTENVRHYNGEFVNNRNQKIYCYYWKSLDKPRALLLISHGFTEHSMMYDGLANEMARKGFFVFAHDHAGHGHSEGMRAYMNDMYELVDDSVTHIKLVREEYPDIPLFVCGHSMGGAVALLLSLGKEVEMSGTVLIAPALAANPETATFLKVTIAKMMNKLYPQFPLGTTDYRISCQNQDKVEEMNSDPLRYHGYWRVRPVICLLQTAEEIVKKSSEVKLPFLLLHGDCDKICHLSGAETFFKEASSKDKTFKVYPGAYHSLLNEPQEIADDVFNQTVQWLVERA